MKCWSPFIMKTTYTHKNMRMQKCLTTEVTQHCWFLVLMFDLVSRLRFSVNVRVEGPVCRIYRIEKDLLAEMECNILYFVFISV